MHNLLSSLPLRPLGQLRMEQCLMSDSDEERGVAGGLAGGDLDGKFQMCN